MKLHSKFIAASSIVLTCLLGFSASLHTQGKSDKKTLMARGKTIYNEYCTTCHQPDGKGLPPVYPPVAKADYLMKDKKRNIVNMLYGLKGPIKVNGKSYNGVMVPLPDKYNSDSDIASVLTYTYNSFGNKGPVVKPDEVAKVRKAGNPNKSSSKKKKKKKK